MYIYTHICTQNFKEPTAKTLKLMPSFFIQASNSLLIGSLSVLSTGTNSSKSFKSEQPQQA